MYGCLWWYKLSKIFHTCTSHSEGWDFRHSLKSVFVKVACFPSPKHTSLWRTQCVVSPCYNCYLRLHLSMLLLSLNARIVYKLFPRPPCDAKTQVCQFMPTSRMRHYSCTVQYATLEEVGSDSVCCCMFCVFVFGSAQLPESWRRHIFTTITRLLPNEFPLKCRNVTGME